MRMCLSMYSFADGSVQFTATTVFTFAGRRCSTRAIYSINTVSLVIILENAKQYHKYHSKNLGNKVFLDDYTSYIRKTQKTKVCGNLPSLSDYGFSIRCMEIWAFERDGRKYKHTLNLFQLSFYLRISLLFSL